MNDNADVCYTRSTMMQRNHWRKYVEQIHRHEISAVIRSFNDFKLMKKVSLQIETREILVLLILFAVTTVHSRCIT